MNDKYRNETLMLRDSIKSLIHELVDILSLVKSYSFFGETAYSEKDGHYMTITIDGKDAKGMKGRVISSALYLLPCVLGENIARKGDSVFYRKGKRNYKVLEIIAK